MSIKSWRHDLIAQRPLRTPDTIKSVDDSEWGVSADILAEIVANHAERKQEVDNIILSKEQQSFLLQEDVLKQEFSGRQEVPRYFPRSVFDNRAEEESRRVIREEFTRSFVTVSVYGDQPDTIESISDSISDNDPSSPCIFHHYQPVYPSWPSTLKNSIVIQPKLKNYIHGETIDDRSILVKLKKVNYKNRFEPLFASVCLYCFVPEGYFVRITEVHKFDITDHTIRVKYPFLYSHRSDFSSTSNDNSPCLLSIPGEISYDNLFLVATISKVLTGSPDISIMPYVKTSSIPKIDEAKHIELSKRLQDYRQTVGFGVIRVFDEQERCGQHGGRNVSFPVFAYRNAMNDNQLGSLVRELIPINHTSPVPTPMTIQKAKAEVIDIDIIFSVSDVGNSLKLTDSLSKNPKPPKIDDIDVVTSTEYYSTLQVDTPTMTDNPMSLDQAKSPRAKEAKASKTCPIVKLKAFVREGMTQRSAEIIRHMYTTEESMMYLYPLMIENFRERNLCVQIELVEFASTPTSLSSLSTAEHISIPCIINQNRSPYLSTSAYTDVFYHNKAPSLHDEIKIKLPEFVNTRHYLKFTVQHIHVKPRYVNNNNFLGGLLTGNQPKELDSSFVVLGVGYQPLLLNDGRTGHYILPDNDYVLQVTETLMGPVLDADMQDGKRKSNNVLPCVRFVSRTLSSFNSSCSTVQRVLRNFPRRGGYFPSSSHERFGDSYSGLSMKEYLLSKDKTYARDDVLLKILKDFMMSSNAREIQKFFFVEFRFLSRLITYQQLNDDANGGGNMSNIAVEDKRSDDDHAASMITNIRSTAFVSLIKLFSIMSGEPTIIKRDTMRTGGEQTITAYVELLFDEEEDSSTYRKPENESSKDIISPSGRFKPSSFSYSEVYNGEKFASSSSSNDNISVAMVDRMAEYFVIQSERFIFESVLQEIVDSLDIPALFKDFRGVSAGSEFFLPQKCIRWWSNQLLYNETNNDISPESNIVVSHPFDYEGEWFRNIEKLHGHIAPTYEQKMLLEHEEAASEDISDDSDVATDLPDLTALPFLPRYDQLKESKPNKLWIYEQISMQWLSILLAINMKATGSDIKTNDINLKFDSISDNSVDYMNVYSSILSSTTHPIVHSDLRNQLANNSHILFRLIWKSLSLRIVRDCLKTPVVIPDTLLNILTQLFAQICFELTDPALGLPQARRMTIAMTQFVRSLAIIIVPNQYKVLFSTCLLAFNDTGNPELLELKLILLEELGSIDNFVAINCPYTEDAPFSTLLVCGYPHDLKSFESYQPDKYTSSGNYRYEAAVDGFDMHTNDTGMTVVPSWYALGLANEYLVLMRLGDSSIKKMSLTALRNMIIRPFHDIRFNIPTFSPSAFSRISTLYLPLLLSFISGTDKLNAQAFDSRQRKEILIITVGLLQNLSEKVLRELIRHLCFLDQYCFWFRMPITPPNRDRTSLYPPVVDKSLVMKCKIYNFQRLLHFALDTFERPPLGGTDPSNVQQAMALLIPGLKLDNSIRSFPNNTDVITATTSRSGSNLISPTNNEFTAGTAAAISALEAHPKTDDALNKRLLSPKPSGKSFGDGFKDLQSMVPFPRGTTESKVIGAKSEKTPMKSNMYPPSSVDGIAERRRMADVVKNELSTPIGYNPSPRAIVNIKKNNDYIAMECALSVSGITFMTVLRCIYAMLEEIPSLYADHTADNTTGGDDDNLLHFLSSILLLLLHVLYSSPSMEITWKVFELASWIIQNFGFHLFYHAAGDTLQDWLRRSLAICYDTTAMVEPSSSQGLRAYESPLGSPDVVREGETETDGSSHFISLLLYSCFSYTGSTIRLKYMILSVCQEFVTTTVNEDQGGFAMKKQMMLAKKRMQSSIDVLRDRFNTVFIKIMKSCAHVASYYRIPATNVKAFLSSVDNLLGKVKIIVKAYAYIIKQVGVDRIIRYNYNGENSLDGSYDTIPQTGMNSNDMIDMPKVVTPLRIDYHLTISLLMKAADVFDPLYLPRFHIFWLENIAMIHDIYGNIAESAIARLRIFDVCKNVSDIWDSLWVPRPPIIWSDRTPSVSDNAKRDFFSLFIENLNGPRPQVWRDWYQYRQHMKTVLMKTISILSAAGIVKWEQRVSSELVDFFQSQGDNIKAAEEYARLGASISRATTRGLDKFSMGNFYRVHFGGYAVPEHLRDKTFIYRDASNSHISEFQESLKLSLSRMIDKGVEIVIGADHHENAQLAQQYPALMILGSIRPSFDVQLKSSEVYFSHKVNTFKYEVPFTLGGKSHSQRIDEQYKKKITLSVDEPFPCTFVRQVVTRKEIIILNPIQVAIDDIRERICQMEKFLAMRSISDPTILREMMRVLQGSIMPQVNAGVAEVAKTFLMKPSRSRDGSFIATESTASERTESNSTPYTGASDKSQLNSEVTVYDTKDLKVALAQFMDASRRLLRRIGETIDKVDSNSVSSADKPNDKSSKDVTAGHLSSREDLNVQWLDQMKKAYRGVYDKIDPLVNDVYDKGILQRTRSLTSSNGLN